MAIAREVVPSLACPSGCRVAVLQGFMRLFFRQSGQALLSWDDPDLVLVTITF